MSVSGPILACIMSPSWLPMRSARSISTPVLGLRLVKTTVNFDDPGSYISISPTKPVAPARW